MKNRELLPVGVKPAPGDLVFVQGFINLLGYIKTLRESEGIKTLKKWMSRHGFISSATPVTLADLKTTFLLHEALLGLLKANNSGEADKRTIKLLNQLVNRFKLTIVFLNNGKARLQPAGRGMEKALGNILGLVIIAMTDGHWQQLRICANEKCQWIFYDASKNHTGRWCSMSVCGARAKARTYRRRKISGGKQSG